MTNKELVQLATAINKMKLQEGNPPVILNQLILKTMKALRLWLLRRVRPNIDMRLDDFDSAELQWGLDRLAFEAY